MKPTVRRLEEEFKGQVAFKALDIDKVENDALKKLYKFRAQPQFVVLNAKGEIVSSKNGTQSFDALKKDIEMALGSK